MCFVIRRRVRGSAFVRSYLFSSPPLSLSRPFNLPILCLFPLIPSVTLCTPIISMLFDKFVLRNHWKFFDNIPGNCFSSDLIWVVREGERRRQRETAWQSDRVRERERERVHNLMPLCLLSDLTCTHLHMSGNFPGYLDRTARSEVHVHMCVRVSAWMGSY